MLLPALANSAGAPAEPATGVIAQLEDRYPPRRVAFADGVEAQAVRSQLPLIEGVGHSFIGSTPAETRSASLQALQTTIEFFDQELEARQR